MITSSSTSRSPPQAYNTTTSQASFNNWHRCLGHPSQCTLRYVILSQSLLVSKLSLESCNSCLCNKSHQLPFGVFSLMSFKPLELTFIFRDLPHHILWKFSILCDFCWPFHQIYMALSSFKKKNQIPLSFFIFKPQSLIYSDNGEEYEGLHPTLSKHEIQHLYSPPTYFTNCGYC